MFKRFATLEDLEEVKKQIGKNNSSVWDILFFPTLSSKQKPKEVTLWGGISALEEKLDALYKTLGYTYSEKECKENVVRKIVTKRKPKKSK